MKQAPVNMDPINDKVTQLFFICSLFAAVNKSCREMKNITYTSGDPDNYLDLTSFQLFLCKLAQICDTMKGGDTITALVAQKAANGPAYLFASNNRKDMELEHTKNFLSDLLGFIGKNPNRLADKPLRKQVLWRILEFNFPRVDYYLKRILTSIGECIDTWHPHITHKTFDMVRHLRDIETKATFTRDINSGSNARNKFLSDCETLIKAIQSARDLDDFGRVINERAGAGESDTSRSWCELRHYLGRLHSYRQAAERIVRASQEWPQLFTGFTVSYIPSSRCTRLPLPKPTPSPWNVIHAAIPDMDHEEYRSHIEMLQEHHLDCHIQEAFRQKLVKQLVHCEVNLQDFLVRRRSVEPSEYWNSSMFIATSKPPCRLCHYYFSESDNKFQVQSSHMNVYPKWRLPDISEEQGEDATQRRNELLEEIIERMQQDIRRIVKEKFPQGKRNDSRTESRGVSTALGNNYGERSETRNSSSLFSMSGTSGRGESTEGQDFEGRDSEFLTTIGRFDFVDIGAAV